MNDARIVRKVFLWNVRNSRWGKKCQDGSEEWSGN